MSLMTFLDSLHCHLFAKVNSNPKLFLKNLIKLPKHDSYIVK